MNDPVVWRLLWKEYRVQRAFWLSMAGIAVLGQLVCLAIPGSYPGDVSSWAFAWAMVWPGLYALGCGATLFAVEQEEGTIEQLRMLAAPAGRVFLSKLLFGVASTATLAGVLWMLAVVLRRGQLPAAHEYRVDPREAWRLWGVLCVEGFVWGLFASLITNRVLTAACMGVAGVLWSDFLIGSVFGNYALRDAPAGSFGLVLLAPYRLMGAALALALCWPLAWRWMKGRWF